MKYIKKKDRTEEEKEEYSSLSPTIIKRSKSRYCQNVECPDRGQEQERLNRVAVGKKVVSGFKVNRRILREEIRLYCDKCKEKMKDLIIELEEEEAKRWAIGFDACISCESNETPHNAGGLCQNCYTSKMNKRLRNL